MDAWYMYVVYLAVLVIVGVFEYFHILGTGVTQTILILIIGHFFGFSTKQPTLQAIALDPLTSQKPQGILDNTGK